MFNNIKKRKELIDRELKVYRQEKLAEISMEISQNYLDCRQQLAENEHDFHYQKETLGIEIAKLEAIKESYVSHLEEKLENYISEYKAVSLAKDKTISSLETALEKAIEKIPTQVSNITTNNK